MNNNAVARHLLEIGAVALKPSDPFTWSSGLKSPIYCDNRLTMSYPDVRKELIKGFKEIVNIHFPDATVVAGTATAGIPHAAWAAEALNLPMVYVRSKAKGHGKQNLIEGRINKGDRVVVIEDLISTGGSSISAVKAIQEEGAHVLGVAAIFTYGLKKAEKLFQEAEVPFYTITSFNTLIEEAEGLSSSEKEMLSAWQQDPESWSDQQ
ncbi:orotate phosphoribosyltransferase [Alteribacter keqinensis]|uniref:Orotate phosphoribosyltransferase n=1 Tax=Alteribacter keqinensis TaxID=2483800 RepID=A0A3M7TWL0_9BACI|nr:orotate phosphoribosyltransferase [Alteribacter keqinensis]RNA69659.1 orotate phosphoribosyltransferase [Alteribacter keqinensis]